MVRQHSAFGLVGRLGWLASLLVCTGLTSRLMATIQNQIAAGGNGVNAENIQESIMLKPWTGPQGGVPPWDQVKQEDFLPAIRQAIDLAKQDLNRIANQSESPTFDNTLVALELAGKPLARVQALFFVHESSLNVGKFSDIQAAVMPLLAEYEDSMIQNGKLFARIAHLHQEMESLSLNEAQRRLLDKQFKTFVRRGARLSSAQQQRLSSINQRLAAVFAEFSQNVLFDEEQDITFLKDRRDLSGLPESLIDALAQAAAEAKAAGSVEQGEWAVTNTRSAVEPFLTYADNRELREKVWRTFANRGDKRGAHDNQKLVAEILNLRAERARLLGFASHAHWRLEPQMAKTPEAALELMLNVWPKAVARVREEVADMQRLVGAEGGTFAIEPWDYRYYAEKVRKAKYDLDFNEVKPYLQLEKLREGMHWCATEVYGLHFRQVEGIPVFHPDVTVWEVTDDKGRPIGLWYFDPFARAGKRSGAWMSEYRTQENIHQWVTPLVSNNSNFIKGKPGEPVLISWDDAVTMFHEFGHALHGLLSQVRYPSQAGTNVARDYVEFPSQVNEHWLTTPEVLAKFAVHVKTGAPMPGALVRKIEQAATFNQGFSTVEYLASAIVDMRLHLEAEGKVDPAAFERDLLAELGMPREIIMRHRIPHFSHLFADDGYSAGYYSYLWSDVLTADAAEAFVEAGGFFDKTTCQRLKDYVFSVGDTLDPAEGFRQFRGRAADPRALLRKRGFPID